MTYNDCLKVVKAQHSDLSYKEQQKAASDMLKKFKDAQEGLASGATPPQIKAPGSELIPAEGKSLTVSTLSSVESMIRTEGCDKNRIVSLGREIMPEGELVKHGRDGVNTLVTFEDHYGNKLPVIGYFKIALWQ
jgi:hypothetical protein